MGSFMFWLIVAVLLAAVVTDLRSCRIPNLLTIPAMATGLLLHTLRDGQAGLVTSLEGLGIGLGLFLILYLACGMGAGDVKLMAAVGSFLGPESTFTAGLLAMLLGGVYAAAVMLGHWGLKESIERMKTMVSMGLVSRQVPSSVCLCGDHLQLRYALVIGLGTLLSQLVIVL
jgi:prepilin peptidase CpaA